MKKIIPFIFLLLILFWCVGRKGKDAGAKTETSISSTKLSHYESIDRLKDIMETEKQVKDYTLTDVGVLYVSVEADGTNRNGLAEYFCQLAKDERLSVNRVRIIRVGSQTDPDRTNAYGVVIGESWCN